VDAFKLVAFFMPEKRTAHAQGAIGFAKTVLC
jgi:hypothetical protein